MKRLFVPLAGLLLIMSLCLSFAPSSFAQARTATFRGNVQDPQGAAVPDADVIARDVATGQEYRTKTTSDGYYTIPDLPSGIYDVRVEAKGFSTGLAKSVKLEVGALRDVNFKLSLSGVTTEVKVAATTPLVETTKTDVSAMVNDKQIENLPVFNTTLSALNDYANLATTAPGVRFDATGNSNDLLGPGSYNNRGNLVNVDGGNMTDQVVSTRDSLGASLDEVKEFQVITNSYTAEYGQAGSVILNVVTKSGTNAIHGTAHAFFRGRNLGASNYFYNEFNPAAAFRRAPFQRQTWGVNAGGPFIKDKTFWFVNFEKVHQAIPLTLINQLPLGNATTVTQPDNEILWSAKLDHQLFHNHQFTARYNVQRAILDNQLVQISTFASPQSLVASITHDATLNLGLVSTVSPRVVNEARFFWHRFLTATPDKTNLAGVLQLNSFGRSYTGAAFCCPQGGLQERYQYVDNVTWTTGKHTIKGGVNISHFPYNSLFQQFHFGEYDLTTSTLSAGIGPAFVATSDTIYGLYAQDSWKIWPNLTVNYGLRYDYEDGGFKGGLLPKPGGGCFQANGVIPACSSDKNNFQPRLGIAYSPRFDSGVGHFIFGGPDKSVVRASIAEVTELAYLNISLDSLNFDGVNLLTLTVPIKSSTADFTPFLTSNAACSPNPAPCVPPAAALAPFETPGSFGRVRPIAPNLHNPETRHLNFDIARQIGDNFVVDAGYIGVLGYGQFGENDINYPAILPDPAHAGFFFFGPRPDSRFAAIRQNQNSRSSAYHAGFISVQRRYGHHLQFQGNYTYSKTLATTEDFYGTSEPGDPRCIRCDRGPAQNDLRHLANFSWVADTNNLISNSWAGHIANNWTLGMAGVLHSGPHYPLSTGEGPFSGSIFPGVGAETQQRPIVLADGTLIATNVASRAGGNLQIGQSGLAGCPTCTQTTFLAPASASSGGTSDSISGDIVDFQMINGTLMRDIGVGDPLYRFDISLSKTVHPTERIALEFRADVVNVFNHPNFTLFNGADAIDVFPIGVTGSAMPGTGVGIGGTCDPTKGPCVAVPNCVNCIRATGPLLGRYIGADGSVLKVQNFLSGKVSKDLANPRFLGVGDPTSADIPRQIQLSFRIKW